jgi:hypothetical protein
MSVQGSAGVWLGLEWNVDADLNLLPTDLMVGEARMIVEADDFPSSSKADR